jgi:uncharacterized protein
MKTVGVISDTHGLLRREALDALAGSDFIIHAGDIGDMTVIESLREIAPVTAVRGNTDCESWAQAIPETEAFEVDGTLFYVLHVLEELAVDPHAAGVDVVVCGHSHRPRIDVRDGVLYLNPGSAGPRRFTLPVTVARVDIDGSRLDPRIIELPLAGRGGGSH